jgi:hypothetical protein
MKPRSFAKEPEGFPQVLSATNYCDEQDTMKQPPT